MIYMTISDTIVTLPPSSLCLPRDWKRFSIATFNIPSNSRAALAWRQMILCKEVSASVLALPIQIFLDLIFSILWVFPSVFLGCVWCCVVRPSVVCWRITTVRVFGEEQSNTNTLAIVQCAGVIVVNYNVHV